MKIKADFFVFFTKIGGLKKITVVIKHKSTAAVNPEVVAVDNCAE